MPDHQAISRVELSFIQPLLNGAGVEYNRSTINIAKLDHQIALNEFQRQLESHLLEISRSYWALYLERGALLQKDRLLTEAEKIYDELRRRHNIDVLPSDLSQARSILSQRKSDLIRASLAVRNAESKLVSLVNDPQWRGNSALELIPSQVPVLFRKVMTASQAGTITG